MATGGPGAGDGAISADPGEAPRLPRLPLRHLPTGLQGLLLPHPPGGSANPAATLRSASDGVLAKQGPD